MSFCAESISAAPALIAPTSHSVVAKSLNISFWLPTAALSGSVQATISCINGIDTHPARTILFNSLFERAGSHTAIIQQLSIATGSVVGVLSVTPAIDLVNNAQYDVKISYQDSIASPTNFALAHNVSFRMPLCCCCVFLCARAFFADFRCVSQSPHTLLVTL